MPTAAKRPCRTVGCGRLVAEGYCEGCQAKGKGKEVRLTSTQRGYGYRWQKTSKAYLAAHPLCADPYRVHDELVVPATQTDHVTPHKGDMKLFWDPHNWQGLCDGCHSRKTASEDGGFGRVIEGRLVGRGRGRIPRRPVP